MKLFQSRQELIANYSDTISEQSTSGDRAYLAKLERNQSFVQQQDNSQGSIMACNAFQETHSSYDKSSKNNKNIFKNKLFRTSMLGLVAILPVQAYAGDAQYYFPKDDSVKSTDKQSNIAVQKTKDTKSAKTNANKTILNPASNSPLALPSNTSFRPDFDGAGGRGPAMVPVEGEKKPDDEGYYIKTRGYRLEPEPTVPVYARQADKTYKELKDIDWLNIGLDSRTRFEYRENDYRPYTDGNIYTNVNGGSNFPNSKGLRAYPNSLWLSRTRGYIGIKNILDPFRAVVEFQDSRAFNSIYELQGQEVNQTELIQGYGELFLKDALGTDAKGQERPISVRVGRQAFEIGSRRLIARNEFRNTTNNFEGVRILLGERYNDIDLDSFALRPVIRNPYTWDQPDWQNWIYGSFLSIKNVSPYLTIQPYFIGRHAWGDPSNWASGAKVPRQTQAPGFRVFGNYNNFDWDIDVMKQFGQIGVISTAYPYNPSWMTGTVGYNNISKPWGGYYQTKQQDAIAYAADVGYTFADHPWKPRISAVYIYGSGNKSAYSSTSNNVDQFYGFNQPFSRNDYISWNNVKDPKVRLEFSPAKDTQIDTAFSAYWLASAASAWDRANLYAPNGNRGTFMGTELDMRIRQKVSQFWNISASYARFWPGSFTSSFAPPVALQMPPTWAAGGTAPGQTGTTYGLTGRPSNFFYLEANANAFGDGKPIANLPGSEFVAYWDEGQKKSKEPSWTDVYVGVNAGGSISKGSMQVQNLATADDTATTSWRSNTIAATTLNIFPTTYNQNLSGFLGGLTYGANYKLANSFVVGVEGDLAGTAGNTNTIWDIFSKTNYTWGSKGYTAGTTYTTYGQHTATLNYLGTGRGRLGFLVTPELLLFGTAGFAYGGVISANSYVTVANTSATAPTVYGPQFTGTLTGWTAGGGLEWAISPQWSVKADYLYYNLGSVNAYSLGSNNTFSSTSFNSSPFGIISQSTTAFSGNIIRGGVNRHFDLLNAEAKATDKPVLAAAIGSTGSLTKKAGVEAKPVNWGGAYAGLNLGGIWANQNSINNITAWPALDAPPQIVSSNAWLSGSVPASGTAALLGGGQIGYNLELNKLWKLKFVAGLEADIQGVTPGGTKGTRSFLTTLVPVVGATNQALVSQSATNSLSYIGTARGRFGFTLIPSILLYGTGGVAYGNTNTSLQTFSGLGSYGDGSAWQGGSGSVSTFQVGWTAGGGTEWAFKENWSVKGEYLYYDLGKASGSVMNYAYNPNQDPQFSSESQFTQRYAGNILRAGVNYHIPVEKAQPVISGY